MRPIPLLAFVVLLATPLRAEDDTRAGTVLDRQGTALVRPAGRTRWTPIGPRSILMPGDLVRTPKRGANAVEIELAGKGRLVVGPGTLVEIPGANAVRLLHGEIETTAIETVNLPGFLGPNVLPLDMSQTHVFRGHGKKAERIAEPSWLVGCRGSTTDEWMGSLVATVDGRDVPLSVGYHKVTVDIRDQIARTTIEQSFVNATKFTLEGNFYFPLPADASISSFGMWIGDELVEADIVEKQRARAIYEDILRQRKDPGLLEWSGGNLFQARVFPIFPHAEKRIRIQYTQVLPLEGSELRYRYALRSELLRKRPLRRLELIVRVSSAMPIRTIGSPSHEVRAQSTAHAASVEFSADEYTPDRDFEVKIGLDRSEPLRVIPHRRDEDGYFMVLLTPPDPSAGGWQRELLPETAPLDVILVADTSGSIDPAARAVQESFLQALLGLLGENDRFRLLACDVAAPWFDENPRAPTEANAEEALAWLAKRPSSGWTDLERALSAVRERATEKTVVVYVGDGIGTTGDADPIALAERVRKLGKGIGHAVSVSSTYEQPVLDALASIGGGSVRRATDGPATAAYELLAEAAQPAIKDLRVRIDGVRTARVYPETLPNLPGGMQQIVLGRFLPEGNEPSGTVTVTGTLDGKEVRYTTKLTLRADEEGNSFLPRLWARRHLDSLLRQGRTAAVQEEIVAFSEEYGIMTPFTSFLVLENDAQREQYGVTRRVRMRDGERFFAKGRDDAATELLQQQMKAARTWRLRLRAWMLREIATLGRHLHDQQHDFPGSTVTAIGIGGGAGWSRGLAGGEFFGGRVEQRARDFGKFFGDEGVEYGDGALEEFPIETEEVDDHNEVDTDFDFEEEGFDAPWGGVPPGMRVPSDPTEFRPPPIGLLGGKRAAARSPFDRMSDLRRHLALERWGDSFSGYLPWPQIPLVPPAPLPAAEADDPDWPAPALRILRAIDRRAAVLALDGGLRVKREHAVVHAVNGHVRSLDLRNALLGSGGWFVRTVIDTRPVHDHWLAGGRRGVLDVGLRLGRTRDAGDGDRNAWPIDFGTSHLLATYRRYAAEWKDGVLTLRAPGGYDEEHRFRFDLEKQVLVEWTQVRDGAVVFRRVWSDFVEVAGHWWARREQWFDDHGRMNQRTAWTIEALAPDAYATALRAAAAIPDDAIVLTEPVPTLPEAKQAAFLKRGTFADHLVLAFHFLQSQQGDRALEEWTRAEKLVSGKPGARWLRAAFLAAARRGAEAKELLESLAPPPEGVARRAVAQHLLSQAQAVLGPNEMLAFVDRLRPAMAEHDYLRTRAQWLQQTGHPDQALVVRHDLARARPFDLQDVQAHLQLVRQLEGTGPAVDGCVAALQGGGWNEYEFDQLYGFWTDTLWERREPAAMLAAARAWMAADTASPAACERYLSALVFTGRENEADAWTQEQLEKGSGPALGAAIAYALGQGWNYYTRVVEERWWKPLGACALRLARGSARDWAYATRITGHPHFAATDEAAAFRAAMRADLAAQNALGEMDVDRLVRTVRLLGWTRADVDDDTWRATVDRLKARCEKEDEAMRGPVRDLVLWLLDLRGEREEAVAYLRTRGRRPEIATLLIPRLLQLDWTAEREAELFALVPVLAVEGLTDAQRVDRAGREVRRLAAELEPKRRAALLGPVAELEKKPRAERRALERDARQTARLGFAEALAGYRGAAEPFVAPWIELERLTLLAEARTGDVYGGAAELFGGAEDRILKERCAYVLAYIATRPDAEAKLADAVVAFLRDAKIEHFDRAYHRFRLLVALDRPNELEAMLQEWITPASAESRWRIALGYVLAEGGRLDEAVAMFEDVARRDELGPAEYRAMADWLLVLGRADAREDALLQRDRTSAENVLWQRVSQAIQRVSPHGDEPPGEIDVDDLRALRALLEKARYPGNAIHLVQSLYRPTKDVRVLACLPYGAIGHTADRVYPFLRTVTQVVAEVHEEATCDELARSLASLREAERTPLDHRALRLLEALVERRASEVRNAPGPHARRGVEALRAAAKGEWQPGEPVQMAAWLASLERVPDEAFAAEQLRQLQDLREREPAGSIDRLQVTQSLGGALHAYGRTAEAIDTLAAGLDEYTAGGALPPAGNAALNQLTAWLQTAGRYLDAETRIEAERKRADSRPQRLWLQSRLFDLYNAAVGARASLSFGRGDDLFAIAAARMEKAMHDDGADQLPSTLGSYCALHATAKKGEAFEAFTRERFPALVPGDLYDRHGLVGTVAQTLRQVRGPRPALAFVIAQIESEPEWMRRIDLDGWRQYGRSIPDWRARVGDLGDLEPRLLRIATRELEEDLVGLRNVSSALFQFHAGGFWKEKAGTFLAVARKVVEMHPDVIARVRHAAVYMWAGLDARDAAIETLVAADARGRLDEDGRWQLAQWLAEQKRWAESLRVVDALLAARPETMPYRILQIRALHYTGADERARARYDEFVEWVRERNARHEHTILAAARTAAECGMDERAARAYEELIPLHQRTHPNRGVGQGTLSTYYGEVGRVYLALGRVDDAVDAAAAAVVAWGPTHGNRQNAIRALHGVVAGLPELDAFVARYETRVAESGLDAPLLRKALGAAYAGRREWRKAIPHLIAARALQPTDGTTHTALVQAYDALERKAEAIEALRESVRLSPFDLDLHAELGRRLAEAGDAAEAERAWTTLVEVLPNDAASHRRLAGHRAEQGDHAAAAEQWRQVVRIRTSEPDGWLNLAKAEIAANDLEAAKKTLQEILDRTWESNQPKQEAATLLRSIGA